MDAACKLSSCSCFLEGNSRQRFEPNRATVISHLASDWMQHYPQFQFLISDLGGCFVSNELRGWAGVRGIGLLTAPGEFHGLTADLENLIRVIKRLARKLADNHPEWTLASCVPWRALLNTTVSRLEDTRRSSGLEEQTMRGTGSRLRCPLRLRPSGCRR